MNCLYWVLAMVLLGYLAFRAMPARPPKPRTRGHWKGDNE